MYASQLEELGGTPQQIAFAGFIDANLNDTGLPAYKSLDLMQIPKLVPHIWVVDARDGMDKRLKLLFTGTNIDRHFGRNLMGEQLVKNNAGQYSREVFAAYHSVFTEKKPVFTERSDYYPGVEPEVERRIKVVLFPCTTDGEVIDFAIGLTTFEKTDNRLLGKPKIVRLDVPG